MTAMLLVMSVCLCWLSINAASVQQPACSPRGTAMHPVIGDCSSYWICHNGIGRQERCPSNQLFNDATMTCDASGSSNCPRHNKLANKQLDGGFPHPDCPKEDPKEPVIIPHDEDCGKFYICARGVAHEKTCLTTLHFNRKLKVCDYPENADCQTRLRHSVEAGNCPTSNSGTVTFLPHESDCTLYYMCDSGKPILRNCPPGLHFNELEQVCDFSYRAGCVQGRERELTEGTTVVITTTTVEAVGSPSPFCPTIDEDFPFFFPDENNCSVYYMCGNGLAYKFVCPDELHFNIGKNVCDFPRNAKCLDRQQSVQKSKCPTTNKETLTILPHDLDCTRYYMCESGVAIERFCPDGLHFNPKSEVCDYPDVAGCIAEA